MYNMLHLKDSALPYSLFLFGDELDPEIPPDLYVMTTAWYGVSSTGNQANVAIDRYHKGDELPIKVSVTGGSGPARVWGHVKIVGQSAEEKLMASVSNEP